MMHPRQTRARLWPAPGLVLLACAALFVQSCRISDPDAGLQIPPPESQSVSLFREVVSLQIENGRLVGRGFYYFRNPHSTEQAAPAAMQFFVAAWQSAPENVELTHVLPDEDIRLPYVWIDGSLPFTQIVIPPLELYVLRIDWEQPLSEKRFAYLLERGQPWSGRRNLRLDIQLPRETRDVRMSLKPSHKFKSDLHRSFIIVRESFLPGANLVVEWD